MPEMLSITNCLKKYFPRNFTTLIAVIEAMICMSGSKTLLNISRWTNVCYKTLERFYDRAIPWLEINWILLRNFAPSTDFIVASDETVVNKSGLSIIHPEKKRSYPLLLSQLVFTKEEKERSKALKEHKKQSKGKKVGRPKGSKNNKHEKPLAPSFRLLKEQLEQLKRVTKLSLPYFVGDGKYGNQTCVNICHETGHHLISKLQYNSALYFKYTRSYQGKGRPKTYGKKVDYNQIPDKYLVQEKVHKQVTTKIYHLPMLINPSFNCVLNVVIIQKVTASKVAQVLLFSTDLGLAYQTIIDYYSARFQIEFSFRDAKQFWGLEDFMNVKENRIHNAANLAFFMVTFSTILLDKLRIIHQNPTSGIRDLISSYRADRYYQETLKLLWKFNPHILIPDTHDTIMSIGCIHV